MITKIMKKHLIGLSFVVCLLSFSMSLTSCMDFEPEAELSDAQVWDKAANYQLFANQFYGYLHDIQANTSGGYQNQDS